MRVNLITQSSGQIKSGTATIPLSLTIQPAYGLPGEYEYSTDSASLVWMLRKQTDLPAAVIERFEWNLYTSLNARLLGVELSERVLTEIGYFID
jgi:hypothetical protein